MSEDLIKRDSVIKILHMIDEKLSTEQCDDKAKQCMYECAREMLSILQKAVNAIPRANEEYVRFSDVAKALDDGMCTFYDCDIGEKLPSADRQGWVDKAISIIDEMEIEGIIAYEQAWEFRMRARMKGKSDE